MTKPWNKSSTYHREVIMPSYAYERIRQADNKHILKRVSANSYGRNTKKCFVQLYTKTGAWINPDPEKKLLKAQYIEDDTIDQYNAEPCRFVGATLKRKAYFTRGQARGEGTTRYYMPGLSVPHLLKNPLRAFAYAIAKNTMSKEIEMRLIHYIDKLDDLDISALIEGAVGYIDDYVIPAVNVYRNDTFISDLKKALKDLVPYTRFNK